MAYTTSEESTFRTHLRLVAESPQTLRSVHVAELEREMPRAIDPVRFFGWLAAKMGNGRARNAVLRAAEDAKAQAQPDSKDERLIAFALNTLRTLDEDEHWGPDTTDAIRDSAYEFELGHPEAETSRFRVHSSLVECINWTKRDCDHCGGTGIIDAPTSEYDPSCPDCDGEGSTEIGTEAEPPSDAALILAAIVSGRARWEPSSSGTGGELCYGGIRYSHRLDDAGCPMLTDGDRVALARIRQ